MPTALSMAPLHSLCQHDQNAVQHGLLVMWHHWPWNWYHMMLRASSVAPLLYLGQDIQMKCTITVLFMWCHWCQCHMMPTASSVVPWHFLGQDVCNEMQHNLFHYMIPLMPALASYGANCIINSTIALLRWRWPKWGSKWLFGHIRLLALVSVSWHQWHHQCHHCIP